MKKITYYDNFGRAFSPVALGMPYTPVAEACVTLDVDVPDSMGFETHQAINRIKDLVGGDVVEFVADRLGYATKMDLCRALAAEQIDAVALAIYNIEAYGQSIIIGDQTGIGKGRQAAALIRYGYQQGILPIFMTEKPNLFSDMYRDLAAIGSAELVPFIVNGKESKTNVKDEEGNIVYSAPEPGRQKTIFESKKLPAEFNYVMATYSQFNSPDKSPTKPAFLKEIGRGAIFIFDEAHNASGSSNVGAFMQSVIRECHGVLFLSATYAKRPDNMPLYAIKTVISEANMSTDDLIQGIEQGGVALQEVLSSQLVKEGQMLRRERSYEGIEVNYITLDKLEKKHKEISDTITEIIRDIIAFQERDITPVIKQKDKIEAASYNQVEARKGTSKAGVDNLPYFSKVFNVINQMLFSIKAEATAERCIMRLKEGKKPVIAFGSTMETFLDELGDVGDKVKADFSLVLQKGLDAVMRYTIRDAAGEPTYAQVRLDELTVASRIAYQEIYEKIQKVSTGISISPIDVIKARLQQAGYTVAEVTGRDKELIINPNTLVGEIALRKKLNTNDAFRMFNNNEVDVLMINQSGSTGASAHAIPTKKVPASQVRQRTMIVLQPELDINREVQKRGRINRTGQILKPEYDYLSSAIPAEKRLMMMLQRKLKSLDANTTSNQKQSSAILSVPDFLNKIGDEIVVQYLVENPKVNMLIGDPLSLRSAKNNDAQDSDEISSDKVEDAAGRVSGRVAILSTEMQTKFYDEIFTRYNDQVEYLKSIGEYDLELEVLDLKAKTISSKVAIMGKGGRSDFGKDTFIEVCECNVLRKPFTKKEVKELVDRETKGKSPIKIQADILAEFEEYTAKDLKNTLAEVNLRYEQEIANVPNEKQILKIEDSEQRAAAISQRIDELSDARMENLHYTEKKLSNKAEYMRSFLSYFLIGKGINYPVTSFDDGELISKGVFLGVTIDKKRPNPYAPSAVKFKFAVADSTRSITLVASGKQGAKINGIIVASTRLGNEADRILDHWNDYTKESNVNRRNRYILTGNIIQAYSSFKGNLISYTTESGDIKKGMIMPENWKPTEREEQFLNIPIKNAENIIMKLSPGAIIQTNIGIQIQKKYQGEDYLIVVPSGKQKYGHIFLDADLLNIVENRNFDLVSGHMRALITGNNMPAAIDLIQAKFNASVQVHKNILGDDYKPEQKSAVPEVSLKPTKRIPEGQATAKKKDQEEKSDSSFQFELELLELELDLIKLDKKK